MTREGGARSGAPGRARGERTRSPSEAPVSLTIYYAACGGGEECITACPRGDEVWEVRPVRANFFWLPERTLPRPVVAHPELCLGCLICLQACPTGALRLGPSERGPLEVLRLLWNLIRLPLKGRFGVRYTLSRRHLERFLRNNLGISAEGSAGTGNA